MPDITDSVNRYREAVRHLWNTAFRATPVNWDTHDRFSRVATELFSALVLEPAGASEQQLPEMFERNPAHFQRIAISPASDQIPILINRELQSHGYWDHPINTLRKGDAEIRLSRFFDWDELGERDFHYALVYIVSWRNHDELANRFALAECGHIRFVLLPSSAI